MSVQDTAATEEEALRPDPWSTAAAREARWCPCCGLRWHRLSLLLFRIAIPCVAILALAKSALCIVYIVAVYRFLHEPHPDDDSYALAALAYVVFCPLLVKCAVEFGLVKGCWWSMRAEFWSFCCTRTRQTRRPEQQGAPVSVAAATVAGSGGMDPVVVAVAEEPSFSPRMESREASGVSGCGAVEQPSSKRGPDVQEAEAGPPPLRVEAEDTREAGCLHHGSCCFAMHLLLSLLLLALSILNSAWMIHCLADLALIIVTVAKAAFLLLYVVALIAHAASSRGNR